MMYMERGISIYLPRNAACDVYGTGDVYLSTYLSRNAASDVYGTRDVYLFRQFPELSGSGTGTPGPGNISAGHSGTKCLTQVEILVAK